jgi:hypothetical protein
MSSTVYLILNETTFLGTDQITTEVVEASLDLQAVLDSIQDIAEDSGVYVEDDANSVVLKGSPGTGVDADEYYIVEMELKNG